MSTQPLRPPASSIKQRAATLIQKAEAIAQARNNISQQENLNRAANTQHLFSKAAADNSRGELSESFPLRMRQPTTTSHNNIDLACTQAVNDDGEALNQVY